MATDWGTGGAGQFIGKTHSQIHAEIDPARLRLPQPFVVCVIGASRGIGAGIATSYAKAGATAVILASRRTSGLEATAAACRQANAGIRAVVVPCDITSAESVAALAAKAEAEFGRLDVVAVNAGYSGPCLVRLTDVDPATFRQASEVNYLGTFHCARFLIPLLLATNPKDGNGGGARAFIAVSSMAALIVRGPIANAQYCASKMGQLKLVEHVHEEYAAQGLAAYSVHPGSVASEQALETSPEEFRRHLTDSEDLCGAFCVWLTAGEGKRWLSGRLLSAKWDTEELEGLREEIVEKDLLKTRLTLG